MGSTTAATSSAFTSPSSYLKRRGEKSINKLHVGSYALTEQYFEKGREGGGVATNFAILLFKEISYTVELVLTV